jgi:hypothetical protein
MLLFAKKIDFSTIRNFSQTFQRITGLLPCAQGEAMALRQYIFVFPNMHGRVAIETNPDFTTPWSK